MLLEREYVKEMSSTDDIMWSFCVIMLINNWCTRVIIIFGVHTFEMEVIMSKAYATNKKYTFR